MNDEKLNMTQIIQRGSLYLFIYFYVFSATKQFYIYFNRVESYIKQYFYIYFLIFCSLSFPQKIWDDVNL